MVDMNPVPEGIENSCLQCGRRLSGKEPISHVRESPRGLKVVTRFCSEECARAFEATVAEEEAEFEEIDRAGAT